MTTTPAPVPQPGDLADHRSGELDPRRVTRVTEDGTGVYLDILCSESGPFPVENYEFARDVEVTR